MGSEVQAAGLQRKGKRLEQGPGWQSHLLLVCVRAVQGYVPTGSLVELAFRKSNGLTSASSVCRRVIGTRTAQSRLDGADGKVKPFHRQPHRSLGEEKYRNESVFVRNPKLDFDLRGSFSDVWGCLGKFLTDCVSLAGTVSTG